MRYLGMRVLRGPDWDQDETDGGEGHLGTVVEVKAEEGTVEVVWDNGQVIACRVGKDGKHDLRIYDNATAGECVSRGVVCQGCGNSSIYGTSWRCSTCSNLDLCSRCYHLGVHPLSHTFLRRDDHTQQGVAVGTRSGARKIPVFGIFPEARVARGRDWQYGDADGGPDGSGIVVEVVSPERDSARNVVRVSWDSGQSLQHRLGLHGKTDLVCTEEAPGPACYVSHLPVLRASFNMQNSTKLEAAVPIPAVPMTTAATSLKGKTKTDLAKDFRRVTEKDVTTEETPTSTADKVTLDKTNMTAAKDVKLGKPAVATAGQVRNDTGHASTTEGFTLDAEGEIRVGDRVEVGVDFETFRDIQSQTASWTGNMEQCMGRTGVVRSITAASEMEVDFEGNTSRISSICLTKVTKTNSTATKFKEGDTVRIISDVRLLEEQQKDLGGWNPDMAHAAGKVGKVKRVTPRGGVDVSLGQQSWVFNPQSCRPAPGCPTDFVPAGDTEGLLHAFLSEGSPKVKEFIDAVKEGNTTKIVDMMQRDPGLVYEERHGATALHYASKEGRTDVVRLLVARGANVKGDYHRDTPLMLAIFSRHPETARVLVELGADVNRGNSSGITPLHVAASANCTQSVRLLLSNKASVNVRNSRNITPLFVAVTEDADDAIIDAILAVEDLDLRHPNKQQATCLHLAVYTDRTRLAEKILARDPGVVDATMDQAVTALHLAAQENHADIARLLLRSNARINARDASGRTPLHLTALADHMECSRQLVESGADMNACDDHSYTPLHCCIGSFSSQKQLMRGDKGLELAKYLIQHGARTDTLNRKGQTPLESAPRAVRKELERFLLHREEGSKGNLNADLDCNDLSAVTDRSLGGKRHFQSEVPTNETNDLQGPALAKGKPANNEEEPKTRDKAKPDAVRLLHAVDLGDVAVIKAMLEQDPNLVRETHEGQTALHYAAMQGQTEVVRLLVAKGADINKGDNDEDTPLLRSILALQTETARVLMELGADVNHINNRVMTSLHMAVTGDAIDVVRLLLQHRASVNLRNHDGNTPLVLALCMDHGSPAVVEALLGARDLDLSVTTNQDANALHMAVHKNKTGVVEKILAKDPGLVNVLMERRKSPLHIAARDSHVECLKRLLKAGANVNARDQSGRTPLHLACPGDYRETARILVQHGADLNVRNEDGNTPLHFCVAFHSGRNRSPSEDKGLGLAKYLIQQGARTDLYNNRGQSILDAAQPVVRKGLKEFLRGRGSQTAPKNRSSEEDNNASTPVESTPASVKCVTCHQRDADVIFLPCAHKPLCRQCVGNARNCRECGVVIEGKIDTEGNAVGPVPAPIADPTPEKSNTNGQQECKVQ